MWFHVEKTFSREEKRMMKVMRNIKAKTWQKKKKKGKEGWEKYHEKASRLGWEMKE